MNFSPGKKKSAQKAALIGENTLYKKMNLKKLCICALVLFSCAAAEAQTVSKNSYTSDKGHSGTISCQPGITVINLHGSYDEMGQQYGALARTQLHEMYTRIVPLYFNKHQLRSIRSYFWRTCYNLKIDESEKQILRGMARTSGLDYYQLLNLDMLPMLATLYGGQIDPRNLAAPSADSSGHCSFVSIWGKQSRSQSMVVARNLDLPTNINKLVPYATLVVYQPDNGGNKVATFGFLGSIPGFTWINNKQVFVEYNDARKSIPGYNLRGFINLNINFYAMFKADSSEGVIDYIRKHPTMTSNFAGIVTPASSTTVENPCNDKPAVLTGQYPTANFFTNLYRTQFKHSELTMNNCTPGVKDSMSYACQRYYAINRYLQSHQVIGADDLKKLFTLPIENGGVYQTAVSAKYPVDDMTVYTVIGDVAHGKYSYSTFADKNRWTDLDISRLFAE
jgi:hypothetical protein